jgi:hypothetical protein
MFDAEKEHREYGPLLQRMKVVTADGESQMDEDQWEAASEWHFTLHLVRASMLIVLIVIKIFISALHSKKDDLNNGDVGYYFCPLTLYCDISVHT